MAPKAPGGESMPPVRARELRKAMTLQEVKLWLRLRELRAIGHHFRRQSPLKPYVVDFECRKSLLIVEIDGHQHGFDEHRQRDAIRDQELERRGYKVLRFTNGEVGREIDAVMQAIYLALTNPHPAARQRARPPSPGGRGGIEARLLLLQKRLDHPRRLRRLLFHDPVAGVLDDAAFDIAGDFAHHHGLRVAE